MRATKPLHPHRKPLIVHISSFGGTSYSFNVAYGVGKAGVDRMARDMNQELSKLGIVCLSLYPAVVRTERMAGVLDSGVWRDKTGLELPKSFVESPQLTGQVIAALYDRSAADGFLQKVAGKVNKYRTFIYTCTHCSKDNYSMHKVYVCVFAICEPALLNDSMLFDAFWQSEV